MVDDIAVNRAVLLDLLSPLGFELRAVTNGTDALRAAPEFQPDLVFLDLRMPGMDGLELARQLRAHSNAPSTRSAPALKIVAMSASVLSFNRDDAFAAGCDDFLAKPFREADLLAKLALHLGVTWLEEDTATESAGSERGEIPDTAALQTLLAAAQRGEIATLRRRVADLRTSHPGFARDLQPLLASYRLEDVRAHLAGLLP